MNVPSRSWFALLLICSAVFCAFIAVFAIPPLMGMLTRQFQISYARAGLFMTAYTMIPTFGSLLIGSYSDRIGVRRAVLNGLTLLGAAGILSSFTRTFWQMLACRILIGIGATSIFVPGLATVLHLLPPARVNLATGAFFSSLNLGLSVAMLASPILAKSLGWRVPLSLFGALALVLSAIILSFTNKDFFRRSGTATSKSTRAPARENPGWALVLVSAGNFLLFFQSFAMITWLPEYLSQQRQFPSGQVGAISMLLGLVIIPGSVLAGWLADRVGAWLVAVSGAVLCAICPTVLVLAPALIPSEVSFVICLLSLGTSLLTIPLTSVLAKLVAQEHSGKAVGLILTTGYSGAIVSTYLGGYLLTASGNYRWTFFMCSLAMLLTLALLAFLRETYFLLGQPADLPADRLR
ncbi:MAG: MFS transporter [Terriglobales bacterium]